MSKWTQILVFELLRIITNLDASLGNVITIEDCLINIAILLKNYFYSQILFSNKQQTLEFLLIADKYFISPSRREKSISQCSKRNSRNLTKNLRKRRVENKIHAREGGVNYRLRVQNLFNRRDEYRFNLFTLASVYTLYADHSHNHNIYTEAPPFLAKVYGVALVIRDPRFSNNVPTRSKIQLSLSLSNEFFLLTRSSKRKEKKWKKRIRIIDRSVLRVRFSPRFLRNRKKTFSRNRHGLFAFLSLTQHEYEFISRFRVHSRAGQTI